MGKVIRSNWFNSSLTKSDALSKPFRANQIKDNISQGYTPSGKGTGIICEITGFPLAFYDRPTLNQIVFSKTLWETLIASEDFQNRMKKFRNMWGEPFHTDELEVDLTEVSHKVTDLYIGDDDIVMGSVELLDTTNGLIVHSLMKSGYVGISSRGWGDLVDSPNFEGCQDVTSETYIHTSFDFVSTPAVPVALATIKSNLEKYGLKDQAIESLSKVASNRDAHNLLNELKQKGTTYYSIPNHLSFLKNAEISFNRGLSMLKGSPTKVKISDIDTSSVTLLSNGSKKILPTKIFMDILNTDDYGMDSLDVRKEIGNGDLLHRVLDYARMLLESPESVKGIEKFVENWQITKEDIDEEAKDIVRAYKEQIKENNDNAKIESKKAGTRGHKKLHSQDDDINEDADIDLNSDEKTGTLDDLENDKSEDKSITPNVERDSLDREDFSSFLLKELENSSDGILLEDSTIVLPSGKRYELREGYLFIPEVDQIIEEGTFPDGQKEVFDIFEYFKGSVFDALNWIAESDTNVANVEFSEDFFSENASGETGDGSLDKEDLSTEGESANIEKGKKNLSDTDLYEGLNQN